MKRRVRKKTNVKQGKRETRAEIQGKEEQLMINLNEAKLMNEKNWIETTETRKNWKKLMKKFVK